MTKSGEKGALFASGLISEDKQLDPHAENKGDLKRAKTKKKVASLVQLDRDWCIWQLSGLIARDFQCLLAA